MTYQQALPAPKLKDGIYLKPMNGYALVHGHHPSLIRMIHPSEAFFLSLCNGTYTLPEISYLFGSTFRLPPADAEPRIARFIDQFQVFVKQVPRSAAPDSMPQARLSPSDFLYPGDDAAIANATYGQWPVPAGINITLTFKCNFNCSYCYQDLLQPDGKMWTFDKCLGLVDEAADWGVVFLGLTGGEPTIFKGWLELIERGLSRGMIPTMTSNGTVIGTSPEYAQRLAAAGMKEITISFDAPNAELHDEITRSKGQFPKVLKAIEHLVDSGIRVVIKCVLTPKNRHLIVPMIDMLADLGVSEIGISYMESGALNSGANLSDNISTGELLEVRKAVLAKRDEYMSVCTIHPPKDATRKWGQDDWYPCGGINMGMSIFPSGDVSVCDKMHGVKDFTYGNVFDSGLRAIWQGDAFQALRERTVDPARIDPDCAKCSKLHMCRTSCFVDAFNQSGKYLAKDPNCGGPFLN
ncbi:radical SAM/SPASM domain-containing protein [Roseibium sp. Sym1]|uniref:radical SAM/SPASM domain-containing protein n=1 Tax=Roseibium sp. Sym1 TaxID=3016006 RepID=UPI0022B43394|nr:radical SAM protein [Roseibium sp. Sym1]